MFNIRSKIWRRSEWGKVLNWSVSQKWHNHVLQHFEADDTSTLTMATLHGLQSISENKRKFTLSSFYYKSSNELWRTQQNNNQMWLQCNNKFKGVFRMLLNIFYSIFCKNSFQPLAVNHFHKKAYHSRSTGY